MKVRTIMLLSIVTAITIALAIAMAVMGYGVHRSLNRPLPVSLEAAQDAHREAARAYRRDPKGHGVEYRYIRTMATLRALERQAK